MLEPFLDRPIDLPIFSPIDAAKERSNKGRQARLEWNRLCREKIAELGEEAARQAGFIKRYGSYKQAKAKPARQPRPAYDRTSYRNAIIRACDAAGVPRFCPYQIRHTALQLADLAAGLDAAQAMAGHSSPNTTRRWYLSQVLPAAARAVEGVAAEVGRNKSAIGQ